MTKICVFTGSKIGARPDYQDAARDLARAMVTRNIGLVYGGGDIGLMGVIADAVLALGGEVIGVIPAMLMERELGHSGISELQIVDSMHARKERMAVQADAFIALPGGLGTLEELFEVLTWFHLGIHKKPCGLLNPAGYFDHLMAFLSHGIKEQFIPSTFQDILTIDDQPDRLIDRLLTRL
jgi:uncharacterized protein (TIGR00730 family)